MMNGKRDSWTHLVQEVFSVPEPEDEIGCDEAGVLTDRCADALRPDEESKRLYPALWNHFRFCPDCEEEYRLVMELARQEAAGELERPVSVPSLPDEGEQPRWSLENVLRVAFPGFSPALVAAATRRGELLVEPAAEPVEVMLAEGGLRVSLDLVMSEEAQGGNDLICAVSAEDEELQDVLEGSPLWLQMADEGPAVREEMLDEIGEASFSQVPPGRYTLRLRLGGNEYAVTGIVLPESHET